MKKKEKGIPKSKEWNPDDPRNAEEVEALSDKGQDTVKNIIKNQTIKRQSRAKRFAFISTIVIAAALLVGGATYAIMQFIDYNNSKVLIDRNDVSVLTLSKDPYFSSPSEILSMSGPRYMDNTTLEMIWYDLPMIENTEGSVENPADYSASTFYLRNITNDTVNIKETLALSNVTQNIDSAMRIMIIRNGKRVIYAKAKNDGSPEEAVPGRGFTVDGSLDGEIWYTVPFVSEEIAYESDDIELKAGEIVKYSIVIWLEGWDEDCVNDKIGGTIKVSFTIETE